MKKIIRLLLILFTYLQSSSGLMLKTYPEQMDRHLYSEALYYKNLALQSENQEEKNSYLDKAIEKLEKAKDTGEPQGRVYYQLSEIYFLKGDVCYLRKNMRTSQLKKRKIISLHTTGSTGL